MANDFKIEIIQRSLLRSHCSAYVYLYFKNRCRRELSYLSSYAFRYVYIVSFEVFYKDLHNEDLW